VPAAVLKLVIPPGPETPLDRVPGIGSLYAQRLAKLNITTVADLLRHLPRRYEDTRAVTPLRQLQPGPEPQTAQVRVVRVGMWRTPVKGRLLVEATLEDEGATAQAVWFHHSFAKRVHQGDELMVSGKVRFDRQGRLEFQSPSFEPVREGRQKHVGRLAPVYPETDKLTSRFLREHIEPLLGVADELPDPTPPEIAMGEGLLPLSEAIRQIHRPESEQLIERARERIAFDELFLLQLAAKRARHRRMLGQGAVIPYDVAAAREFTAALPFRLTDDQRRAANSILKDMAAAGPMNRLLQGDVGSGKTAVAAMAALVAHRSGFQTLVMAPTEILARQHHATLVELLERHGVTVRLLVGSTPVRARREVLAGVAGGNDSLLVGTHALIEDEVAPANLGLIVVDEQHRFGVVQRQRLRRKATVIPNFLAMTATPIPRSLALTLYGDVDLSEIREMPPGRMPAVTRVVPPYEREQAYEDVRTELRAGRQAFVICPLVEGSEKMEAASAVEEHERLRRDVFPDPWVVELLHGRMPSKEKEERMGRFARGEADVLVSTSVVEVGVDVQNATVMLIEDAERFGLAQLHQFRGRVGRGLHPSACLLFQGSVDEEGHSRLQAVAATSSGFDIAELDLRLRGAGDVVGLRQHGLPEMRAADLLDHALLQRATRAAERWLETDPELDRHPALAEAMNGYRSVFDLD
jgi:ATP-dependent DNA helicase RecG